MNKKNSTNLSPFVLISLLTLTVIFTFFACKLSVDNPSMIEDKDLDDPTAIPAIVTGVAGDFAYAAVGPGGGGLYNAGAMLGDELVHCGTWVGLRGLSDGISRDDWVESTYRWRYGSLARWTAEKAVERIKAMVENPESDLDLAYVTMFAGHANRMMGDYFEYAVINGGPPQPNEVWYQRAEQYFTDAIKIAEAAEAAGSKARAKIKVSARDIKLSAYAGRAHVRMMLGNWDGALSDAQQVPTDFVFYQIHSENSSREYNWFRWWAYERTECTVWGTPFAEWGLNVGDPSDPTTEGDPRVPFDKEGGQGGDGRRPFWRQLKYTSYADDIPIVKGTEMRLLEAEAALIKGDYQTAINKINEVRNYHNTTKGWNLPAVTANSVDEAWPILMKERGLELWLEGKRLPDLRRWSKTPGYVPFTVVREENPGRPPEEDPRKNVIESAEILFLRVSKEEKDSNQNF
jgi:hypothetical protein